MSKYRLQPIKLVGESSNASVQLLKTGGIVGQHPSQREIDKEFTKIGGGYKTGGKIEKYLPEKKGGKIVKNKATATNTSIIKINIGKAPLAQAKSIKYKMKPQAKAPLAEAKAKPSTKAPLNSFHSYPREHPQRFSNYYPDLPINNPTNSFLSDRRPVFGGSYQLRPSEALIPNRISPINENFLIKDNDSIIYSKLPTPNFTPEKIPNMPHMSPDSMISNGLNHREREEYKENEAMLNPRYPGYPGVVHEESEEEETPEHRRQYSKAELEKLPFKLKKGHSAGAVSVSGIARARGIKVGRGLNKSDVISLILR